MQKMKVMLRGPIDAVKSMHGDLHDKNSKKVAIALAFFALIILAMLVRKSLIHGTNGDFLTFEGWYDYVKNHGIASFNTDFSNYNPPYTYFLYLVTLLPISKVVALKGLMVFFDLLLALGVYLVAQHFKKDWRVSLLAALGALFVPTVLATGVYWGQFDQLYTAFILFSLYYLLKDRSQLAWLFFGIAIAIKLQAIFFLPVLIIMSFSRIKLWHAVYGLGSFIVLTFLPLFAGRSISSILNIYVAQTNLFKGNLTLNAPSVYQWVPNSAFDFLNNTGLYFTAAVVIGIFIYSLAYNKRSDNAVAVLTALMLFVIPFLLPQMHERYFFTASVGSFLLAVVLPNLKTVLVAIAMQLTVLFSYVPFLYGVPTPVPFSVLALVNLGIVLYLLYLYTKLDVVPKRRQGLVGAHK